MQGEIKISQRANVRERVEKTSEESNQSEFVLVVLEERLKVKLSVK